MATKSRKELERNLLYYKGLFKQMSNSYNENKARGNAPMPSTRGNEFTEIRKGDTYGKMSDRMTKMNAKADKKERSKLGLVSKLITPPKSKKSQKQRGMADASELWYYYPHRGDLSR